MGVDDGIETGRAALRDRRVLRVVSPSPEKTSASVPSYVVPEIHPIKQRRGWLVRRLLLAADLIGLMLAYLITEILFTLGPGNGTLAPDIELVVFLTALPVWVMVANLAGLYDRDTERTDHSTADDLVGVFNVVTGGAWLVYLSAGTTHLIQPDPTRLFSFWGLAITLVVLMRVCARSIAKRTTDFQQNTIIVGAGDVGQLVARKVMQHPEYGINLLGFVDEHPKERRPDLGPLTLLGGPTDLPRLVTELRVERVIIAFSNDSHTAILDLIRALDGLNIQIDVVPRLFEIVGPKVSIHAIESLPLVGIPPTRLPRSSRTVKRVIDVVVSGTMLVLTAPLFAYIAIRVKLDSAGPVFFRQTRLGCSMHEFKVIKFRTMYVDTNPEEHRAYIATVLSSDAAIGDNGLYKPAQESSTTPFGRWLRRTSLDELPQLINVFKGDMSLVGPRPCIPYETEHFEPHQFVRFAVPAGLTGLWQVTARARATFGEALDMDVAYVRGWSLGLDLRLLFRTPLAVLGQRGVT